MGELLDTIQYLTAVYQSVAALFIYVVAAAPFVAALWFAYGAFRVKDAYRNEP